MTMHPAQARVNHLRQQIDTHQVQYRGDFTGYQARMQKLEAEYNAAIRALWRVNDQHRAGLQAADQHLAEYRRGLR